MLKNYNVILLPGDGIGPEVINEAVKVIQDCEDRYKKEIDPKLVD